MNDFKQTQIRLEDRVVHYAARSKRVTTEATHNPMIRDYDSL